MNQETNLWCNLPLDITQKILHEIELNKLIEYILEKFKIFEENNKEDNTYKYSEFLIRKFKDDNIIKISDSQNIYISVLCRYGKRYINLSKKIVKKTSNLDKILYYEKDEKNYTGFDDENFKVIFKLCINKLINFEKDDKNYKYHYHFTDVNLNTQPDAEYIYYNDIPNKFLFSLK